MTLPTQLLSEVRGQIEQSDPPVKAAALLHFARILDREAAEQALEDGIALAKEIPDPGGPPLMHQAVYLAAAVSPRRAVSLMPLLREDHFRSAEGIIFNMLSHGHLAEAVEYLTHPLTGIPYPFHGAQQAFGYSRSDQDTQRKILRGAIAAWRAQAKSRGPDHFDELFVRCRTALPDPEAVEVIQEIVQRIRTDPDNKTSARYGALGKEAKLTSTRESHLFRVYGTVRKLDVALADGLCRKYKQLAAAVAIFPRGYHEESEEALARQIHDEKPAEKCDQPDYMTVARRHRLLPMPEALETDFNEPFEAALQLYAHDTDPANPNSAPKECWFSTCEFRNILYKAGQHQGLAVEKYLARIPNRDLRLLAQIEWLAAMAGLPQLGGLRIPPKSRPDPGSFFFRRRIH